jgi:hypothetical protein
MPAFCLFLCEDKLEAMIGHFYAGATRKPLDRIRVFRAGAAVTATRRWKGACDRARLAPRLGPSHALLHKATISAFGT